MRKGQRTLDAAVWVLLCALGAGPMLSGCAWAGPVHVTSASYQVTEPVGRLVVRAPAGDVRISAGATTSGAVHVEERRTFHGSAPAASHAIGGGTLTLTYTCPGDGGCGIDYTITVPAGLPVQVDDSAGTVTLSGLAGSLDIEDSAGDVRATGLACARLRLRDDAGDVTLGFVSPPADLQVQDAAGDVAVTVPGSTAYTVRANAPAGQVDVRVAQSPGTGHLIQAGSDAGNVSVLAG